MLTTTEIQLILHGKKNFGGVYPINQLPLIIRKPSNFIVNLDPSYKGGSHWVAIYFGKNYAIYFDSFGRCPPENEILTFIKRNCKRYDFSKIKYQGNDSTACGYFCVLFVLMDDKRKFFKIMQKCNHIENEKLIYLNLKKYLQCNQTGRPSRSRENNKIN